MINWRISTVVLAGLLLSACGSQQTVKAPLEWTPVQRDVVAAWANDGSDVAILMESYEEKLGENQNIEQRNVTHQVIVQNPDASARRAITEPRDAYASSVYYMKTAGYFLVESRLVNGGRRFDKVTLDGNEILLMEIPGPKPCGANIAIDDQFIPSPDGQQIAHVHSLECGVVTVSFLDAATLGYIDSKSQMIRKPVQASWHPDGHLLIVDNENSIAWAIEPQEGFRPHPLPSCLKPVTSSGVVSSNGQKLELSDSLLTITTAAPTEIFGCQV